MVMQRGWEFIKAKGVSKELWWTLYGDIGYTNTQIGGVETLANPGYYIINEWVESRRGVWRCFWVYYVLVL